MKLIKVVVSSLFGIFNHPVALKKEGITLILGENGFGKTVILKLINAFFKADYKELARYDYNSFALYFTNAVKVIISKSDDTSIVIKKYKGRKLEHTFEPNTQSEFRDHERSHIYSVSSRTYYSRYPEDIYPDSYYQRNIINEFLPDFIIPIGENLWEDRRSKRKYTFLSLTKRFKKYLPPYFYQDAQLPVWLDQFTNLYQVRFIQTQRLLFSAKSDEKGMFMVSRNSDDIVDKIKNKRAEANDLATKLDRTFPNRLIEKLNESSKIQDETLLQQLGSLEEKRKLLNSVGLVDAVEAYIEPSSFLRGKSQEILKKVFEVYIQDSNRKIAVYEELGSGIKLFVDIINKRFTYKKLTLDKEKGFVFRSTKVKDKVIPLTGLSSGEQHEIVLFYELLFNTPRNSILLVDEPEISLHISWQRDFINDLKKVIHYNPMTVLIATHSPDIIGSYWDLTVQLDGVE